MLKRTFDLLLATVAVVVLVVPCLLIWLAVRVTSPGPALHWSDRVGRHNRIFKMPKFRSMRVDTPAVATHLLDDPQRYFTLIGSFLRKWSLDELPQIWSIIKGNMSFVGPRPVLSSEVDLIALRSDRGVHQLVPGLTGWAQINGRAALSIEKKVALEDDYLKRRSFLFDLQILLLTFSRVITRDGITH